jgi:DNA-binding winged helix-turn-helix (wHTH) protein
VLRCAWTGGELPGAALRVQSTIPSSADHAFDRALLELARAAPAWRSGRLRLAASCLHRATSLAAECEADPDLIPALYEQLQSIAGGGPREASPAALTSSVVIDGIRHQVADRGVRVALTSRVVLRRLLYAFAAANGHHLDRNAICHALWDCNYAPLRHESSVKSNIRRLRELLAGTRVVIQTDRDGYRLSVPPDTVVVHPLRPQ